MMIHLWLCIFWLMITADTSFFLYTYWRVSTLKSFLSNLVAIYRTDYYISCRRNSSLCSKTELAVNNGELFATPYLNCVSCIRVVEIRNKNKKKLRKRFFLKIRVFKAHFKPRLFNWQHVQKDHKCFFLPILGNHIDFSHNSKK